MCKSTSKEEMDDVKRLHAYHADEERSTKSRIRSFCALYFVNFIWKLISSWYTNKQALLYNHFIDRYITAGIITLERW